MITWSFLRDFLDGPSSGVELLESRREEILPPNSLWNSLDPILPEQ